MASYGQVPSEPLDRRADTSRCLFTIRESCFLSEEKSFLSHISSRTLVCALAAESMQRFTSIILSRIIYFYSSRCLHTLKFSRRRLFDDSETEKVQTLGEVLVVMKSSSTFPCPWISQHLFKVFVPHPSLVVRMLINVSNV